MTPASGKAEGGAELLPCPFCGGQPEIKDGHPLALVVCPDCRSRSMAINQYEAKRNWNRRTAAANGPGEAVVWMWQHDETGATGFVANAPAEELRQWERMNKPRRIIGPCYLGASESTPQPGMVTVPREQFLKKVDKSQKNR